MKKKIKETKKVEDDYMTPEEKEKFKRWNDLHPVNREFVRRSPDLWKMTIGHL